MPGMQEKKIVVTLATQSHLAYARALAISMRETNPQISVYVLLIDANHSDADEPFTVIGLSQLSDPSTIRQMSFYYSAFEFCNAVKAYLSQYVSEQLGADKWLYLDSDMMVCGSLDPVWEQLDRGPILLTPHCTKPIPQTDVAYEMGVIKHGIFNGGLLGLKRSQVTSAFLLWFTNRLSRFAFYDDLAGTFVDQTWLTLIPCLFESTVVCRHPGLNIGHWNLHERELTEDENGSVCSNGFPLICAHFSGWDFFNPEKVSKYAPAYLEPPPEQWPALGRKYKELMIRAGFDPAFSEPYCFSRFNDGRDITPRMRKGYYTEVMNGQGPVDPFDSADYFYRKYPPRFYRIRRLLPAGVVRILKSISGR